MRGSLNLLLSYHRKQRLGWTESLGGEVWTLMSLKSCCRPSRAGSSRINWIWTDSIMRHNRLVIMFSHGMRRTHTFLAGEAWTGGWQDGDRDANPGKDWDDERCCFVCWSAQTEFRLLSSARYADCRTWHVGGLLWGSSVFRRKTLSVPPYFLIKNVRVTHFVVRTCIEHERRMLYKTHQRIPDRIIIHHKVF